MAINNMQNVIAGQQVNPAMADYAGIGAPSFQYSQVWSATDAYYFFPTAAWDEPASVIRFTQRNHNLLTNDIINLVVGNTTLAPGWAQSGVTVTTVDANTFTIPQVNDPGPWPDGISNPPGPQTILNTGFMVTCVKYSKLMFKPIVIQGDVIPADGTTIIIEGKVHPLAQWVTMNTYNNASGAWGLANITTPYAFVRGRLSAGTSQVTVYASF